MKKLVSIIDYYDEQSDKFFKELFDRSDKNITVSVDPGTNEQRDFYFPPLENVEVKIQDGTYNDLQQTDVYMSEIPEDYQNLVDHLQKVCNCGHSFNVTLSDETGAYGDYFFDGDGATRIYANGRNELVNFSR